MWRTFTLKWDIFIKPRAQRALQKGRQEDCKSQRGWRTPTRPCLMTQDWCAYELPEQLRQHEAGWGLSAETGTRTRPPISSLDAISNWYRLQGKISFLQQSFIQAGPMPSRQWSIQNVLDDIFVDILSHVALFGHFLSYRSFTWILWFLILWGCWEVGVVYVSLFLLLFLCYFLILICLPFFQRKRKRRCGIGWWRSCENWEELVNGKSWSECIVWKIFPINKKKRSVIGKPVGHFLN